jgi:hypothetical protein
MSRSFFLRLLRRVYRLLLYAYPPDFRRRYGKEMEQIFADRCRALVQSPSLGRILSFGANVGSDWVITTIREGIAMMRIPAQVPATTGPALHDAPVFYTCGSEMPRPDALFQGMILSVAVFVTVTFLLGHSGDRRILFLGSHHPSPSHLLRAQTTAVPSARPESEIKVKPYPDEPPVFPYFKLMPVLRALDADHDNVISAAEIANAPSALKTLDNDHDGKLSAEECGYRFERRDFRLAFMRLHPVLNALDTDHDGEISSSEIRHAAPALRALDKNGDGKLTLDELLPRLPAE